MPKASIIIPAHNAENFIGETLQSILKQTFTDYECIVVNDGSTDATVAVVEGVVDPRFRVISLPGSGGPAAPRNAGLKASVGQYIFMFDADDIMHPEKLEKSINAMDANPEAGWLFSNFQRIDESGHVITENFLEEYRTLWELVGQEKGVNFIPSNALFNALTKVNFVGTSSAVLRRNNIKCNNVFDENLKNSDDRLFFYSFSKNNGAIFINDFLHQYRVQEASISAKDFYRRAPSKIAALLKMRDICVNHQQCQCINRQLHENYLAQANSLRRSKKKGAFEALSNSLRYGLTKEWGRAMLAFLAFYK